MKQIFVFGVDGATFDLIMPLVKQGRLPAFSELIREGVSGELTSVVPPVSAPSWASFATGKKPGKHGIFNFYCRRKGSYEVSPINSAYLRCKPIWNLLSEKGKKVGVINVPYTYPPDDVNGFMISGKMTPIRENDVSFVYPNSLADEIRREIGEYQIDLGDDNKWYMEGNEDSFIKGLYRIAENRAKTTLYLMKMYDWDVFIVVFTFIDDAQHWLWHFIDSKSPRYKDEVARKYGDVLYQMYEKVDETLKMILKEINDATILVVSDHGANSLYKFMHINNWLMNLGLLKVKVNPLSQLKLLMFKLGLNPEIIYSLVHKLGVRTLLRILRRRFSSLGSEKREHTLKTIRKFFLSVLDIDWSRTKAYSFGVWAPIYINLKGRETQGIVEPGKEYEDLRDLLVSELYKLVDPETGEMMVDKVYKKEELFSGPYAYEAPDISFLPRDTYMASGHFEFLSNSLVSSSYWSGSHRMNGIFMIQGRNIKRDLTIKNAGIIDIAPTILYLLGLPIPSDMDGRVLNEAIKSSFLKENPIKYEKAKPETTAINIQMTEEDKELVMERLRKLGYV